MLMAHEFFSLLLRSDFVFLVVARGFPRLSPSLWASLLQTVNGNMYSRLHLKTESFLSKFNKELRTYATKNCIINS